MKAVLYGRYSSHNQKDASIEQQFRDCREYCERNDIRIIGEYADRAVTGKSDKRPEFQRMIKDAAKERFGMIICWKVDRFARNREDAAIYKGRLRRHGIRVVYAKESIPEGPEGILLEAMLEGSAEYYSANLSQNIKRGMRDNALSCKVNNGNLALGYQKGSDGCFAIEPAGAKIVREIFEMYADGIKASQIIADMNARKIKTSRGSEFNKNSLRKMLKNERYTGVYIWKDVRIEGGIPQIISKELFDKVQKNIDKTRKSPAASRDVDYLLTGKLFCGHCKSTMIGTSGHGKSGDRFNYYTCTTQRRDKSCKKKAVQKEWLEDLVVRETVDKILVAEVIEKIADAAVALQEKERDKSVLESLISQRKDTEKALKNLLSAIEQGIVTKTTKERMVTLEREKDELEDAIEREKFEKPLITKEQIIYWIGRFKTADLDDERVKLSIIEVFVSAIYLYDGEIRIAYNYCGDKKEVTHELVDNCDKANTPDVSEVFDLTYQSGGEGSRTPVRNRIHKCFYECILFFNVSLHTSPAGRMRMSVAS